MCWNFDDFRDSVSLRRAYADGASGLKQIVDVDSIVCSGCGECVRGVRKWHSYIMDKAGGGRRWWERVFSSVVGR